MNTSHGALHAASPSAQEIPPGRGQDIRPSGPEQGHIAHDDLPADGEALGQGGGAHRPHGLLQRLGLGDLLGGGGDAGGLGLLLPPSGCWA